MKLLGLYKKEKLCSTAAIDALFARGGAQCARLAYPLRMIARLNDRRHSDAPVQFLISVPKKKLRHAVDRVQMRRRIREAFRLNRHLCGLENCRADVAFVYVADKVLPYSNVLKAMQRLLPALGEQLNSTSRTLSHESDS